MSTGINIKSSSDLTVGTTPVTSGTDGRVFFQAGGVIQQDAALFWDNTNKRLGVGATPSTSVRLDVRAQGALSTDIAFRVRNSANTLNIFDVNGLGEVNAKVGNQNLLYLNSTAGFSSAYTGQNFIVNTAVSGVGNNKNNMVLINALDSTGTNTAGVISINTASPVSTSVSIGSNVTNSHRIQLGGFTSQMGFNLSCNTGSMVVGSNMSWVGGGSSSGMFVFGNNVGGGVVNGFANALVFGNGQVDFVIGGGKGNIGVNYNPTGRTETNTIFVKSGTAPTTSITDGFQQYSADIVAGNAAPHFRTEAGDIIKLYKETTGVAAATFVANTSLIANDTATFDGYTIGQVVKALRNLGILA